MKVLDDPKRRSIRQKLAPVIGDEDAENLVSALPSEDDDIVTKQFLRAELSENFSIFRTEMDDKFTTLRSDMDDKFATKEHLKAELAEVRTEIADVRTELAQGMSRQTAWMVGALLGGLTVGMGGSASIAVVIARSLG